MSSTQLEAHIKDLCKVYQEIQNNYVTEKIRVEFIGRNAEFSDARHFEYVIYQDGLTLFKERFVLQFQQSDEEAEQLRVLALKRILYSVFGYGMIQAKRIADQHQELRNQ